MIIPAAVLEEVAPGLIVGAEPFQVAVDVEGEAA